MSDTTSSSLRPARERLLQAAAELFYDDGISATGIDAIIQRAGVAKQSLYNNFTSKAELVATYLEHRHAEWLGLYEKRLEKAETPLEGILAVFDAYRDHAEFAYEHGFRGCGLLNAAAELPAGDPGREAVRKHKEQVEGLLVEHLNGLIPDNPERVSQLAVQLSFILEGAIMRAGLEGNSARLGEARAMVATVLKSE
ncbi:AcrR family transcriptional regulator [Ochrobactrum daejeonense]|uniref:AcrR family transcriptional regulator n=1 Tax=Brucella daejeonensis TaxID=659015 RepID=A0A7W9AYB9_9HYPH|nr:TetR/AcrR family transcriptional regulator [Brucella daejeonensis]MBB5702860.1 AcrR family transcriptional regulator [Brucella daejeonensis]NKB79623.1 TetR/AcrR family transcriptional regulator [Brucella daejeonensis]